MRQGYVKLWRKALDNDWLKNHELWAFWSYCLLRAKHEPGRVRVGFQEVHLEAGQFIFGRAQAARDLGMTEWKIRQCLTFLKGAGNLTSKTASKFSIISIVNWDTYQGSKNGNPPAKPPATRQQPATKKNDKNIYTVDFERFWSVYPRKVNKKKAFRAWQKCEEIRPPLDNLISIVRDQAQLKGWKKDGGRYIPHASTWLNSQRWEDQIEIEEINSGDSSPPYYQGFDSN